MDALDLAKAERESAPPPAARMTGQQKAVFDYLTAARGRGASNYEISAALYIACPWKRIEELNDFLPTGEWNGQIYVPAIVCLKDGISRWGGVKHRYYLREFAPTRTQEERA